MNNQQKTELSKRTQKAVAEILQHPSIRELLHQWGYKVPEQPTANGNTVPLVASWMDGGST